MRVFLPAFKAVENFELRCRSGIFPFMPTFQEIFRILHSLSNQWKFKEDDNF